MGRDGRPRTAATDPADAAPRGARRAAAHHRAHPAESLKTNLPAPAGTRAVEGLDVRVAGGWLLRGEASSGTTLTLRHSAAGATAPRSSPRGLLTALPPALKEELAPLARSSSPAARPPLAHVPRRWRPGSAITTSTRCPSTCVAKAARWPCSSASGGRLVHLLRQRDGGAAAHPGHPGPAGRWLRPPGEQPLLGRLPGARQRCTRLGGGLSRGRGALGALSIRPPGAAGTR